MGGAARGGRPLFRKKTEELTMTILRRVSKRQIYTDTQAAG